MAEAFVALIIAVNIAQFVDCAKLLIASGLEIYNSSEGVQDEHQALEAIIEDTKNLIDETKPTKSSSRTSIEVKALQKLGAECVAVADKLLGVLKDLEVPKDARFRALRNVRQTFRGAAKKDIQELQRRLGNIDARLRDRASRKLQK